MIITMDGSMVVQFLTGVVQLLGTEFSILAAYHIFSWQRAESVHAQIVESLNRSLQDFTKAVAVLTKNEAARDIPLHLLQEAEQFEALVSSAIDNADEKTEIAIQQLAESPRRYRHELIKMRHRRMGSLWLWIAMLVSAFGCLLAVCGLLLSKASQTYSLCEIISPAPILDRAVIILTLLVLLASFFSIISILIGLFIQNRRVLHVVSN